MYKIIDVRGGAATATSGWMIMQGSSSIHVSHNDNHISKISYLSRPQEEHVIAVCNNNDGGGNSGLGITCKQRARNNNNNNPSSSSSHTFTDKNKLVHSSFRIEQNVIRALAEAAQKRGDTLSGLVNKTLKNYVTSEMYFEELGFILAAVF